MDASLLPPGRGLAAWMMRYFLPDKRGSSAAEIRASLPRELEQYGRDDSRDTDVGIGRRRLLVGVVMLHGEQEPLQNVVTSSYVVAVLTIHIPHAFRLELRGLQ